MDWFNYHYFFYFYVVVWEGSISVVSEILCLVLLIISVQIKIFEETFDQ